jgi:hypothetical protein
MNEQAKTNDLDELFPPLDGMAMYVMACKMNHSCDPNVAVLYFNTTQPLVAHCVTLRDIDEGEKLCISYIHPMNHYPSGKRHWRIMAFNAHVPSAYDKRQSWKAMN